MSPRPRRSLSLTLAPSQLLSLSCLPRLCPSRYRPLSQTLTETLSLYLSLHLTLHLAPCLSLRPSLWLTLPPPLTLLLSTLLPLSNKHGSFF
jgi:hypothetical protein